MADDAIKRAYTPTPLPKETSSEMEKGIRSDRASVQSVNKLSPERYQKEVNEKRSSDLAGRAAWEASSEKQRYKIAGYKSRGKSSARKGGSK